MSDFVSFYVDTSKVEQALTDLLKKDYEKFKKVIKNSAYEVQAKAKYYCPVDTGRLRASIDVKFPDEYSAEIFSSADLMNNPVEAVKKITVVGTNVYYSVFVEFGTVKMEPQPFLRPAFLEVTSKILDEYEK